MKNNNWTSRLLRVRELRLRSAMASLHQILARRNTARACAERIADAADSIGGEDAALADLSMLGEARLLWHRRAEQFGRQAEGAAATAIEAQHRTDQAAKLANQHKRAEAAARERRTEIQAEEFFAWRR